MGMLANAPKSKKGKAAAALIAAAVAGDWAGNEGEGTASVMDAVVPDEGVDPDDIK